MSDVQVKIDVNETETLAVPEAENVEYYRFDVIQGQVRVGDSRRNASRSDLASSGDRARIDPEPGDDVVVQNVGLNTAIVELTPKNLELTWQTSRNIEVTNKVFPGVETDSITASSNNEVVNFKDQLIPEGAELSISADNGNDGNVFVGNDMEQNFTLAPGQTVTVAVSNMSIPSVKIALSGDTVNGIVEVDN